MRESFDVSPADKCALTLLRNPSSWCTDITKRKAKNAQFQFFTSILNYEHYPNPFC